MLPRFPAGKGIREIGSKRKENEEKRNFLKENATKAAAASAQFLTVFEIMEKRPLSSPSLLSAWAGHALVDSSALLKVGEDHECPPGML